MVEYPKDKPMARLFFSALLVIFLFSAPSRVFSKSVSAGTGSDGASASNSDLSGNEILPASADAAPSFKIQLALSRDHDDITVFPERKNIFTIHVFTDPAIPSASAVYNILYYLDERYETEFKNERLPFSFKRNLRGQESGRHEIRVDMETLDGKTVLSTEKITVYVEE